MARRARSEAAPQAMGRDRHASTNRLPKTARRRSAVVLKGVEVDMLREGGASTFPDDVLAQADWVVASLHYGQNQPRDRITKRIIEAIENPARVVIGGATGRLVGPQPALGVDIEAVIAAAARTGTFLEINANPWRLDLDDHPCPPQAKAAGVKLVMSTDARSTQGFEVMRGAACSRPARTGLEAKDIVNTRPLAKLFE